MHCTKISPEFKFGGPRSRSPGTKNEKVQHFYWESSSGARSAASSMLVGKYMHAVYFSQLSFHQMSDLCIIAIAVWVALKMVTNSEDSTFDILLDLYILSEKVATFLFFWITLSKINQFSWFFDQTVGWIKMKLGTQVGLKPGQCVLDGDPAPPPLKGGRAPNFRPMSIVAQRLDKTKYHLAQR